MFTCAFLTYLSLYERVFNLTTQSIDPLGHVVLMGIFGYAGYWAHRWDIRAAELIEEKRAQIAARRQQHIARLEAHAAANLQE